MSDSSATTSVPAASLSDAGFVAPAEQDILAGVQADINAALGGNANPALNTPQGQIATSETAIIGDCNDQLLALLNGVDPATASGRMQDAIGNISFLTRSPAVATAVTATITTTGGAAVTVPANTPIAWDGTYTYAPTADITIPAGNSYVAANLSCTTAGPIPCAAGALSLYQSVSGVVSVSNAAEGVIGSNVESRAAFELRRSQTVAANSVGTNAAVLAKILAVSGVTDAYVVDNQDRAAETVGGVTLNANSIYCCVAGGAAADIGLAIIKKKPPGCGYTGGTTVTVQDPNPAYGGNGPKYNVAFDVATATPIYIAVTIANSTAVPSDALQQIQTVIINAFTGGDGGTRARIGGKLFASRYYAGIASLGTWAEIVEILIGTSANPTGFTVQLNINQVPTLDDGNITLTLA